MGRVEEAIVDCAGQGTLGVSFPAQLVLKNFSLFPSP